MKFIELTTLEGLSVYINIAYIVKVSQYESNSYISLPHNGLVVIEPIDKVIELINEKDTDY